MFHGNPQRLPEATRAGLLRMLDTLRYELLPIGGALDQVDLLPDGAELAVTADPEQGMDATIGLCVELERRGFTVIPHLSARLIRDRAELARHLDRLGAAGIERALVVGGVAESSGEFLDALSLMEAIRQNGNPFAEIGIGGYPEGHHAIPDESIDRSLLEKAPRAGWITTQICFAPRRVGAWITRQRAQGVDIPIWLGIPGVADVTGLMSLGLRVGAGRSLQFMFEHPRLVGRLVRPGGRKASELVTAFAELATHRELGIGGFHLFTYNQVGAAERWRRRLVRRLG